MAENKKEEPKPFFTTEKTTLYAPKGAKHFDAGQKVDVHPRQVDKFKKFGFAETAEEAASNDAHPAIAAQVPKAPRAKKVASEEPKGEGE
jgi:hypothetical protein